MPPVQLSATAILRPLAFSSSAHTSGISLAYNKKRIGTVTEALVEQVSGDIAYGRTYAEAPEVDGTVMFSIKNKGLKPGDFTMIKLTGAGPYDMEGEEI